jgi:uncharacterized protein
MKVLKSVKHISYASFERIEARESDYLYISNSQIPNAGRGLFTAIPICKDEIISLFKGEILSNYEADERAKKGQNQYFINMLDGHIMDSMYVKCFAKYANDPEGSTKARFKLNATITLDDNNNICLVAQKNIQAGEEVFCRYGKRYWKKYVEHVI